ncbi:serine/threonine-protein kinase [Gardnerella vaginalis]|uniref:serine/threonine-protein kinase n=1 Tax=Gardnerella vaginalis TaxID=2702 RepID=UPI0039EE2F50
MTCVGGRYQLLGELGRGGTSTVFLAVDNVLQRTWAVKEVILGSNPNRDFVMNALKAEISILNRCDHPLIPRIVNYFEENNRAYIVRDYVQGNSLSYIVAKNGAQNAEFVIKIGLELCDILKYLHSLHPCVIYGDMKPANVIINNENHVKLIDFGASQELRTIRDISSNDYGNAIFATKSFSAPEQLDKRANITVQSDIYALAATLGYVLLGKKVEFDKRTGKIDFSYMLNERVSENNMHKRADLDLTSKLCKIVECGMCADPMHRYRSCDDMMNDLLILQKLLSKYKSCAISEIGAVSDAATVASVAAVSNVGAVSDVSTVSGINNVSGISTVSAASMFSASNNQTSDSESCDDNSYDFKEDHSNNSFKDELCEEETGKDFSSCEKKSYASRRERTANKRKNFVRILALVLSGALCFVLSPVSFAVSQRVRNENYDNNIRNCVSALTSKEAEMYCVRAISDESMPMTPVLKLLEYYCKDYRWDESEIVAFNKIISTYEARLRNQPELWSKLSFEIGKAYWFYAFDFFKSENFEDESEVDANNSEISDSKSGRNYKTDDFSNSRGSNSRDDNLNNSDISEKEYAEDVYKAVGWFEEALNSEDSSNYELIKLYKSVAKSYLQLIRESSEESKYFTDNLVNSSEDSTNQNSELSYAQNQQKKSYYRDFCDCLIRLLKKTYENNNAALRIGMAEVAVDSAQFLDATLDDENDKNNVQKTYELAYGLAQSTNTTSRILESRKQQLLSIYEVIKENVGVADNKSEYKDANNKEVNSKKSNSKKSNQNNADKGILIDKKDINTHKYADTGGVYINDDAKGGDGNDFKGMSWSSTRVKSNKNVKQKTTKRN